MPHIVNPSVVQQFKGESIGHPSARPMDDDADVGAKIIDDLVDDLVDDLIVSLTKVDKDVETNKGPEKDAVPMKDGKPPADLKDDSGSAPMKDDKLPAEPPRGSASSKDDMPPAESSYDQRYKRLCNDLIKIRGLKGKQAYNQARRIIADEGLLPKPPKPAKKGPLFIWAKDAKKVETKEEAKGDQKDAKNVEKKEEAKSDQKDDEEPEAKRRRPMDAVKQDLLYKILHGGAIETNEEYQVGRKLLNSQNSMYARAQKEGKPSDEYAKKALAVGKAVDLAMPTFDEKYGSRGAEITKTARTIMNGVDKLTVAATMATDENREKDAEIARLKAELAEERRKR